METKCQRVGVGSLARTSSAQLAIEASDAPGPSNSATPFCASGSSLRCAISTTMECPELPQANTALQAAMRNAAVSTIRRMVEALR